MSGVRTCLYYFSYPILPKIEMKLKPTVLRQSTDKSCQVLRLIKTSVSLCSLITPHKDPWVASMSTFRLKWMFTSPNDYLSQCWVNATASVLSTTTASVLSTTRWGYTESCRDETSSPGLCTGCLTTQDYLQVVIILLCVMICWTPWRLGSTLFARNKYIRASHFSFFYFELHVISNIKKVNSDGCRNLNYKSLRM